MLAHLRRELMHAIWDLLLSPDSIHAYIHGTHVNCYDEVEQMILPPSIARHFDGEKDEDYLYYAVGRLCAQPTIFTPLVDPDAAEEEQRVDVGEDEDGQLPAAPELDNEEHRSDSADEGDYIGFRIRPGLGRGGGGWDVEENAADGGAEGTDQEHTEFLGYSEL
ncbi:hypothetical protein C8F04DRAFT_1400249 [Mycena alexandri]|uniref:Uncharacterized protein n=1 Tax=Mycena alexandri TaxID=1745969 RepID=A0AAD6SIH0_9AGAR|nr:hypothetical protein C8F04DRAFT_1400249 [Mycena alexandri]